MFLYWKFLYLCSFLLSAFYKEEEFETKFEKKKDAWMRLLRCISMPNSITIPFQQNRVFNFSTSFCIQRQSFSKIYFQHRGLRNAWFCTSSQFIFAVSLFHISGIFFINFFEIFRLNLRKLRNMFRAKVFTVNRPPPT